LKNIEEKSSLIDIVIPCYERTEMLEECLKNLEKYTDNYNLILIEGKRSAAENRNLGISKVSSDWFVMLDDDIIVTPNWLDKLLELRREDVGQIQPRVLFLSGEIFSAGISFGGLHLIHHGYKEKGGYEYVCERDLLNGCCSLYNSKILKYCRFDENYRGSQFEDLDFSMQIRKAGFKLIYCGTTSVYHRVCLRNLNLENEEYFYKKWFKTKYYLRKAIRYLRKLKGNFFF